VRGKSFAVRAGTLLFGIGLLLAMCGGCAYGAWNVHHGHASAAWPTTMGTIETSKLIRRRSDSPLRPSVTYSYEVEGRRYRSDRIWFDTTSYTRDEGIHAETAYPVGKQVIVRYRPSSPDVATLRTGTQRNAWIMLVGGAVFLVFHGVLAILLVRREPFVKKHTIWVAPDVL
jgi:hypothetical protein